MPILAKHLPFRAKHAAGVIAITVTYVYFLIFAQFGFLELIKKNIPSIVDLNHVMMAMGLGGVFSSLVTAKFLKKISPLRLLYRGLAGCALAALGATMSHPFGVFVMISLFIGVFLGILTVSLATGISRWVYPKHFGFQVGLGTGLAYAICNIPAVFFATPTRQALFSALLCMLGGGALLLLRTVDQDVVAHEDRAPKSDFTRPGFLLVVLSFLALIWLDSAAFYVIQQTIDLKSSSWDQGSKIWLNGASHLIHAVLAGYLIDRRAYRGLLPFAFIFLTLGLFLLRAKSSLILLTGPVYLGGVSLYSTALVAFPSLYREELGTIPIRWRAAILFGGAGWIGSALGVGMAQDLQHVPGLFLVLSGTVVCGGWLKSTFWKRDEN